MLEGHGDDLHLIKKDIKANFSSNVYFGGCPAELTKVLQKGLSCISNYPSPVANELNVHAGNHYGLNAESFLFTNGATEAFYLLAHLFQGKTASIVVPTFAEYEDACLAHGVEVNLIQPAEIESVQTDCVFICNPNNPDGKAWNDQALWSLIKRKSNVHFIIDEAYIEFTATTASLIEKTQHCKNLTVVRSLTKTFVIPGVRLGYLVSNNAIIEELKMKKMPWSVNAMAILAGAFIFKNYEKLKFDLYLVLEEKERLCQAINKIDGFECKLSSTSYFLVELKFGKAKELKEYLIEQHQVLVRDATNFKGLDGQYIRVAVQSDAQNQRLINGLKEWS